MDHGGVWRAGVRLGLGLVRNVDNLTKNVDADGIMGEHGRSTKYGVCMEPVREFLGYW